MIVNANLIVENLIQIENRIMININKSAKIIVRAKKIRVGILAYVLVRILGI